MLGEYPRDGVSGLGYGKPVLAETVAEAAGSVLELSQVEDSLRTFEEAQPYLREAKEIYFLGFGFHHDNVRRLRVFSDPASSTTTRTVGATTYGLTERQLRTIHTEVMHGHLNGPVSGHDVHPFLTNYVFG